MYKDNNFNLLKFKGVGEYEVPGLEAFNNYDSCEWIGFNYVITSKTKDVGVHFFLDDYQFKRLWLNPKKYINLLKQYKYILTPDFSIYTDMSKSIQLYNHYRKQFLGLFFQSEGLNVIPTISWADEDSFEWCFDGIPKNSTVAISTVGTQNTKLKRELFKKGYEKMMSNLQPTKVICFGKKLDFMGNEVCIITAYCDKIFIKNVIDRR